METQSIVVLDFGAQYSQLIARRIREQSVFSVVLPCNATLDEIRSYSPVGIILSGGPSSVYDQDAPSRRRSRLHARCAGARHLLRTAVHGAHARRQGAPAEKREYGHAGVEVLNGFALVRGLAAKISVWMSHGDEAVELPPGLQSGGAAPERRRRHRKSRNQKMWAVQFHPEVHHTPLGTDILQNFALEHLQARARVDAAALHRRQPSPACARPSATAAPSARSPAASIRRSPPRWWIAPSAARAVRLTCVFVNNGVLRKNEFEKVQQNSAR